MEYPDEIYIGGPNTVLQNGQVVGGSWNVSSIATYKGESVDLVKYIKVDNIGLTPIQIENIMYILEYECGDREAVKNLKKHFESIIKD